MGRRGGSYKRRRSCQIPQIETNRTNELDDVGDFDQEIKCLYLIQRAHKNLNQWPLTQMIVQMSLTKLCDPTTINWTVWLTLTLVNERRLC